MYRALYIIYYLDQQIHNILTVMSIVKYSDSHLCKHFYFINLIDFVTSAYIRKDYLKVI